MAKKNGIKTYVSIAGIVITILLIIAGIVAGYTKLEAKAQSNSEKVDRVEADCSKKVAKTELAPFIEKVKKIEDVTLPNLEGDMDYHDDRLYEQEKEVFGLKKEVGYLGEKVDRNYKVQEQILTEIKELHK